LPFPREPPRRIFKVNNFSRGLLDREKVWKNGNKNGRVLLRRRRKEVGSIISFAKHGNTKNEMEK
jgi:hypothetical protein